jgi:hypothetical protein
VVVIGVADFMVLKIFMVPEIMTGDVVAAVDGVARKMMARKTMPVKRVSGECVRAKRTTHMDWTMGREAMEAVEAAKAMHAAERRMESTAAHMKAASSSASAKVKAALRHCRGIRGNAERTDRNAGRQNRYRSFHGSFHGRFPTVIVPAAAMSRWARIQSTLVFNCSHLLRVSRWRQEGCELIFRNRCSAKARPPQITGHRS